jgi:Ti-type conjugative transfer relaxase TraA
MYLLREGKKWEHKRDHLVVSEGSYPAWANGDAGKFWRAVDKFDNGRRWEEFNFSVDHALSIEDRMSVLREWREKIIPEGCPYTLAIHKKGDSGHENWHCHIQYYTAKDDGLERTPEHWFKRAAAPYRHRVTKEMVCPPPEDGGARKLKEYFGVRGFISSARESWAKHASKYMEERGYGIFIDHRSYKERGIDMQPKKHLGKVATQARREGVGTQNELAGYLLSENKRITYDNGNRIIADPSVAFDYLTYHSSTFEDRDLFKFLHAQTADEEQYFRALAAVKSSPELVKIGDRFTTVSLLQTEAKMVSWSQDLAGKNTHQIDYTRAHQIAEARGLYDDQKCAFIHILQGGDSVAVTGFAGGGKSYMLAAVRQVYEEQGYHLRGTALAGQAAASLQQSSAIDSRTLHSLLAQIDSGKIRFTPNDVVVLDEAAMVGTRQYARLIGEVREAGAKLIQIGDKGQLQSIEAGGGFKAITSRIGVVELAEIRRQKEEWARRATQNFGQARTREALTEYIDRGKVHAGENREIAMRSMVAAWHEAPGESKIMLAATRADTARLNELARDVMSEQLGPDAELETETGKRRFATGDSVMFTRNEYNKLRIKNGTRGTLESVSEAGDMTVRLADEEREVTFSVQDYGHIDHAYATTIHKAQGATADHSFVFAARSMDRHSTYVALSRHREDAHLYYDREEIQGVHDLQGICSRNREKDLALDFAEARGIDLDDNQRRQEQIHESLDQARAFEGQTRPEEQGEPRPISETLGQDLAAQQDGRLAEWREERVEQQRQDMLAQHEDKWQWLQDDKEVARRAAEDHWQQQDGSNQYIEQQRVVEGLREQGQASQAHLDHIDVLLAMTSPHSPDYAHLSSERLPVEARAEEARSQYGQGERRLEEMQRESDPTGYYNERVTEMRRETWQIEGEVEKARGAEFDEQYNAAERHYADQERQPVTKEEREQQAQPGREQRENQDQQQIARQQEGEPRRISDQLPERTDQGDQRRLSEQLPERENQAPQPSRGQEQEEKHRISDQLPERTDQGDQRRLSEQLPERVDQSLSQPNSEQREEQEKQQGTSRPGPIPTR